MFSFFFWLNSNKNIIVEFSSLYKIVFIKIGAQNDT